MLSLSSLRLFSGIGRILDQGSSEKKVTANPIGVYSFCIEILDSDFIDRFPTAVSSSGSDMFAAWIE
jgi:hypothetical protein